jgi:hypothetical protein
VLRGGLQELPELVVVARTGGAGGTTRVLVRGGAEVRLARPDGDVLVTGDPARTWVEESHDGVRAVTVTVPGAGHAVGPADAGDTALTVARGLVRVSRVELAAAAAGSLEGPLSPLPEPPEALEQPEGTAPHRFGEDADRSVAGPDPQAQPPTEAWFFPDREGRTERGDAPVARLLFSSGDVADVDRVVLVGRAPDASRVRSGDGPAGEPLLVPVPSPNHEISSTHLEVRPGAGPDLGLAVVTDLGSTNGTLLVQPGLPPEDLKAGIGVQLLPGAVIDLGDGLSIRVVEP